MIVRLSFGSSPSQMIAICSPRVARCRSRQLAETLRVPSSNHLIETSGAVEGGVLDLGERPDPVDPLRLLGPEPFRIVDRALVHGAIARLVDQRALRPVGRNRIDLLGHFVSPSEFLVLRRATLVSPRNHNQGMLAGCKPIVGKPQAAGVAGRIPVAPFTAGSGGPCEEREPVHAAAARQEQWSRR